MSAGNASKGDPGQVSGNEAVATAAQRGKKNEINKGFNVSTYGDRNPATYDFVHSKTKKKPLPKYIPTALKAGLKVADAAGNIIDSVTDGARKNKQFMVDNYDRIGKNFKLPDRTTFNKMSTDKKNEIYSDMRSNFMKNNKNPFGETTRHGGENSAGQKIIQKNIGGNTITTTAPTEAEVSQSEAANADAAALKVKKRGRSASIMTGSKGVTRTSTDYSLGKKSLLGRV